MKFQLACTVRKSTGNLRARATGRELTNSDTYKTELKLDKEVGGGDFSELCTVTYLITYPYGWTVNFEIWNLRFKHRGTKYGMLLTTHQPPIAKASQTSAWSHRYIGNWVGKTEGSPIGFIAILWRLKTCKIALVKVTDLVPLRALFGPGAPDADLSIFKLGFSHELIVHNTARWIHRCAALNTCTQSVRWIHVRRHTESHTTMH